MHKQKATFKAEPHSVKNNLLHKAASTPGGCEAARAAQVRSDKT